jgi:UDP-2,4-diacetamido-2,4,6-trideoxy-beta-L-altropyranose hydrolase
MKSLLFRADGSKELGMGHITRDTDLAKCLRKHYSRICFLTKGNPETTDYIRKNGFRAITFPDGGCTNDDGKVQKLLEKEKFDDIILDVYHIRQNEIDFYKKFCRRVICFTDEVGKVDIVSDIVFAFSAKQKKEYYKDVSRGRFYVGPSYFPLKQIFYNKRKKGTKRDTKRILITLGGTDAGNLTTRVLDNLLEINYNFEITAILGPGFGKIEPETINRYVKHGVIIKRNVKDMCNEILKTDIGICAAGNTLLEFMCLGIPALILPQTKRENENCSIYEEKGAVLKVPNHGDKIIDKNIRELLKELLFNIDSRNELSRNASEIIDGKGLLRIADILTKG